MSEIRRLTQADESIVKKYIYNQFWECIELAKAFDKNGLQNNKNSKDAGEYLGYFEDDTLKGIFLFTNNKRFLLHFTSDLVTKKVDLLKAIKHFQPEFMSGSAYHVNVIWKMFERTVKRYTYNDSIYMVLNKKAPLYEQNETSVLIREATPDDARKQINFLIQLEKHFGRNHMMMNQLQKRIESRIGKYEYLVVEEQDKLIAQGFIEDKINAFWQIGGIYTSPAHRGKRIAEQIVLKLVDTAMDQGNIPILAVLKKNKNALALYQRLGFEQVVDFAIIELEF